MLCQHRLQLEIVDVQAGPLVNVVLVPVTFGALWIANLPDFSDSLSLDIHHFLYAAAMMNAGLLIFNVMLPIYPLDGGQILQALLWFVIGRSKSLLVVSVIGMVAGAGLVVLAIFVGEIWLGIIAIFAVLQSLAGFQQARLLARLENAPRHEEAECPSCKTSPVMGKFWACDQCQTRFDTFRHGAVCPGCGKSSCRLMLRGSLGVLH